MANTPIVSDSNNPAYDGFLSTANGFYAGEAWNMGSDSSTAVALSTTRYINSTFAHAGNLQGIILGMYSELAYSTVTPYGVDVRLEQIATVTLTIASPCVVTLTGHGFSGGERVSITTTGALPTGLTATSTYFVKYINANTFNLSLTSGGANINTSGTQSGTHTLGVERAVKTLTSSDINPEFVQGGTPYVTTGIARLTGFVPFKFTTPYAVDTTASKWRFRVAHDTTIGATNTWSLTTSDTTNPTYVAWCDNQATATNGDILCIADKVYIDKSFTTGGAVGTGTTTPGYGGLICRTTDISRGGVCLMEWHPTPAASYTFTCAGLIAFGKFSGLRIGTHVDFTTSLSSGATSATLAAPWAWTTGTYQLVFSSMSVWKTVTLTNGSTAVSWTGGLSENVENWGAVAINNSSQAIVTRSSAPAAGTGACGFVGLAGVGSSSRERGKGAFCLYGEVPAKPYGILASDAAISQAVIEMTEDLSSAWAVNDYVYVGKQDTQSQGTTVWQQIQNISGTTITLTSNLLTNARKAGGCVLNRDRGWGIKFLGYSNAAYLYAFIDPPNYLDIRGVQFYDTYMQFYGVGSNYMYKCLPQNRARSQICDNSFVFTSTTALYGIVSLMIPPEGAIVERNWSFRGHVLSSLYTYVSRAVPAYPWIAGELEYNDNISLSVASGGTLAPTAGYSKINADNNVVQNTSSSYLTYYSGKNSIFTNNVFWGGGTTAGNYGTVALSNSVAVRSENNSFDNCLNAIGPVNGTTILAFESFDDKFGVEQANTYDFASITNGYFDLVFNSPTGNINIDYTQTDFSETVDLSRLSIVDEDNTANKDRTVKTYGEIVRCGDGLTDTTVHTAGSGKFSARFESKSSTDALMWESTRPTGNIQNKDLVIAVWCKINSATYYSGTHQQPRVTVEFDNGTQTYVDAAASTAWQLITVPVSPTTTFGQIKVTLSTRTDATGSDAYVYWDDASVLDPAGVVVNTGGFDLWSDGVPITPIISTSISAQDVWAADPATFGVGTVGAWVNKLLSVGKFLGLK